MSSDKIKVIARIRPLLSKEVARGDDIVAYVTNGNTNINLESRSVSGISRNYKLDNVLDESNSQRDVFNHVKPLIDDLFDGFNCSLFTYGQTGTGKTHTMLGYDLWSMAQTESSTSEGTSMHLDQRYPELSRDETNMGIIPRSMLHIFKEIERIQAESDNQVHCQIQISYIEIYNEKLVDLLNSESQVGSLDIRENKKGVITVTNLMEVEVANVSQVFEVLWTGAQARCIATTDMNDYSSRSHTIFQVRMTQTNQSTNIVKRGKLCFIDLAGSEKWKSHQLSQFSVERIKELTSINKSLSALGNCIAALLKPNSKGHIPYRDSKLTRLLQDSLGGNTKTVFIVTISPSSGCLEETTSTLQFADRAMKVQIFASPNVSTLSSNTDSKDTALEMERYRQEILNLKAMVQSLLHSKNGSGSSGSSGDEVTEAAALEITALREENHTLQRRLGEVIRDLSFTQSQCSHLVKQLLGAAVHLDSVAGAEASPSSTSPFKIPVGEQELQGTSSVVFDRVEFNRKHDAQVACLEQLLSNIEQRSQQQSEAEVAQEDRWQSLLEYHTFLQAQAQVREQLDAQQQGNAWTEESDDDNVMQRVNLLEKSILYQSEELRRAKTNYLKMGNEVQWQLQESRKDVAALQEALLRVTGSDSFAQSILSNLTAARLQQTASVGTMTDTVEPPLSALESKVPPVITAVVSPTVPPKSMTTASPATPSRPAVVTTSPSAGGSEKLTSKLTSKAVEKREVGGLSPPSTAVNSDARSKETSNGVDASVDATSLTADKDSAEELALADKKKLSRSKLPTLRAPSSATKPSTASHPPSASKERTLIAEEVKSRLNELTSATSPAHKTAPVVPMSVDMQYVKSELQRLLDTVDGGVSVAHPTAFHQSGKADRKVAEPQRIQKTNGYEAQIATLNNKRVSTGTSSFAQPQHGKKSGVPSVISAVVVTKPTRSVSANKSLSRNNSRSTTPVTMRSVTPSRIPKSQTPQQQPVSILKSANRAIPPKPLGARFEDSKSELHSAQSLKASFMRENGEFDIESAVAMFMDDFQSDRAALGEMELSPDPREEQAQTPLSQRLENLELGIAHFRGSSAGRSDSLELPVDTESSASATTSLEDTISESQENKVSSKDKKRASATSKQQQRANSRKQSTDESKPVVPAKPLWREYTDPKTQLSYYHNKVSNVTTWVRPSETDMRLVVVTQEDGTTAIVDVYDVLT